MTGAQGAVGQIFHDQIGSLLLDAVVAHLHDMGMLYMSDDPCFALEGSMGLRLHTHMQQLDRYRKLQVAMFPQIDFGERPFVEIAQQQVVADLLSDPISLLTHGVMLFLPC